ncbi:MAG: ISL3 family transposase, partial [Acidaminococcaceae bacterium]
EFRGNAGGEKFQCNLTNPVTHKILDILPSKNTEKLYQYFLQFPLKERLKVKLVVMDLSSLFRSVMTTLFPNAEITADKFHVIRLAVWAMENVRKKVQKQFYKERRKWCKRSKRLLTTPENKLNSDEKLELNRLLRMSKELGTAYALKEYFYKIFQTKTKEAATNQLSNWLMLAAESQLQEFRSCITTFTRWSNEIANIIDKQVTNAFTEGIHNKIKVIKRISFGVRNFNRFRNRILYLC